MLKDLVLQNRSYRKFLANQEVSKETLMSLIELARITPSSKNRQPLKYILLNSKEHTNVVFENLGWAKYLEDWDGPGVDERPPAYIVMLVDKAINDRAMIDAGIAAQTILLGATEKNLGGCIIRTVNREKLSTYFNLPDHIEIIQVLAIGVPDQIVGLTEVGEDGSIEYFEDENEVHWVPKRKLDDIIYSF
jgi:nitroreductase